ncbi:hypothetical protein EV177_005202 [Coemansia sp. RSA 1804]|nr:hypothetical protein EV177_005202 [Coemansia sp. RSA 1804]
MITEAHKTPLALSIATGIDESDRIKLAAKQKVAWQHAQPRYVKYSDFLTHALNRRQWDRINLVLKRMVVDSVRWGIPTRVAPRLLDRCIDDLFSLLVADSRQNRLSVPVATTDRNALLAAASHLAEIAWRTDQDTSNLYPKWELVALFAAAFAEDGAGGQNTAYVHALRNLEIAICAGNCATVRQTLVDVLNSSYLTPRLLSDIFAACQIAGDVRTDVLLTTDLVAAFYLALQRPDQLGSANLHEMAEKVNHGLLEGHSFITRTLSGNANSRSSANTARAAVALIHLLLTRPHREKQISGILAHLDRLSAMARWPMGALAHSVRLLVDVGELKEAQDLVLSVGNGNIKAFMQTLQNTGMLGKEPHFGCASAMRGFTGTRNVILREYLRHGIEPPPEALAVFAHHMRISGEHERAQDFAAAIMPQMFPQLTGEQSAGKQAVRAYYEWMLYSCRNRGRKLLQLFSHLMGHHGVDSIGFKIKLVELTICLFLHHKHFHGMGFYQLERVFVRYVDRPWFPTKYVNSVRLRFWALHMFLRQKQYIPNLRIRPYQFCTTRSNGVYRMEITAIPSKAKIKAQGINFAPCPIVEEDVDTAISIFMKPRRPKDSKPKKYSVESVTEKYSRLVSANMN